MFHRLRKKGGTKEREGRREGLKEQKQEKEKAEALPILL